MKPRARYWQTGIGYWVVRSRREDGYIIQGIGSTLELAYRDWASNAEYVRYLT